MLISELIRDLQETLDNTGDLNVEIAVNGSAYQIEPSDIFIREDGGLCTDYVISVEFEEE